MGKKFCPQCGNQVNADVKFCPHCGADLTNVASRPATAGETKKAASPKRQAVASKPQPVKKKTKFILIAAVVVFVLFGVFYAWGSNHYSRSNQIDQIMVSLKNPQMPLAKYVTTDDYAMKVTDESLKPTQKYYQAHQSTANNLAIALKSGTSLDQVSLKQSGRYLLFFPKYTLHLNTYTPQVKTNHANSTVLINGQAVGQAKGDGEYYQKLKPLFPGKYQFEVKSSVAKRTLKANANVNIWSNKTVNLNIKTATFTIKSLPGAKVYLNDHQVGKLANGSKTFKDYPITNNMEVYVTTNVGNEVLRSKVITDLPSAVAAQDDDDFSDDIDFDDGRIILYPQWKGLIDKDEAEDALEAAFNGPDSSNFIGGSDNSSYQELHKMLRGFDHNDSTDYYDIDCDVVAINPAPNNSSSVTYKVTYDFEKSNGDEHTQVMLYKNGLFQLDGNEQKIKSIGGGTIIRDTTDDSNEYDDDDD
ncbi:zinc-ribbon domain-containing protein [Lactobacillus sp. ESL0684]|uniref:zinc ribbon domain-containing protein n=1 Tax=Lactobacillus sp. ESL0684 TaxID=2983213 RepID=UPI0023F862E4|nr:zinc-ribbon domain-containing protein [Lactobacillus sp. ESL0684]WEV43512.1 zinc-ribbon domain-containing protein [Lactobacillus sp. ESL0684]